jgi:hypothetical protein
VPQSSPRGSVSRGRNANCCFDQYQASFDVWFTRHPTHPSIQAFHNTDPVTAADGVLQISVTSGPRSTDITSFGHPCPRYPHTSPAPLLLPSDPNITSTGHAAPRRNGPHQRQEVCVCKVYQRASCISLYAYRASPVRGQEKGQASESVCLL